MDFNGSDFTQEGVLEIMLEDYVEKWEKQYHIQANKELGVGLRFRDILETAHRQTGRRAVVLVDEYDKPILDVLGLDDSHLQFVLLTGVTKFSQVSVFSGFNQPDDISMDARYETLCGITQEEMERYFTEPITSMAQNYHCTVEEMKQMLKQQYDGYHFSEKMTDVYTPFSLLNAFNKQSIRDYWFSSGTPTYLIRLLAHFNENMNELTGKYYGLEEFIDYKGL